MGLDFAKFDPTGQSLIAPAGKVSGAMPEPPRRVIVPRGVRFQSLESGNTTPKAPMPEPSRWVIAPLGVRCQSLESGIDALLGADARVQGLGLRLKTPAGHLVPSDLAEMRPLVGPDTALSGPKGLLTAVGWILIVSPFWAVTPAHWVASKSFRPPDKIHAHPLRTKPLTRKPPSPNLKLSHPEKYRENRYCIVQIPLLG